MSRIDGRQLDRALVENAEQERMYAELQAERDALLAVARASSAWVHQNGGTNYAPGTPTPADNLLDAVLKWEQR